MDEKDKFGFTFNTTDFEIKQTGEELYVGGFISVEELDENGDITNQEKLLQKINDSTNPYAKYLSYKHNWIKGDKKDFANALGVLDGNAEIKIHPNGKKGVYANYHLLKTSPYYDAAVYDIKNKGVSGFSTEFKDAKRKNVNLGSKIVNYLDDFTFGGVGILARPAVKSSYISGFYAKEYYYNEDEPIESKTIEEGAKNMENKEEVVKPVEVPNPTEATIPVVDNSNKVNEDLEKLKSEINTNKQELEKYKLEQERERIKQELENLKAKPKVLIDGSEQNTFNSNPQPSSDELIEQEIKAIQSDKKLDIYGKAYKIFMKQAEQQKR